jgi:hypothetical protein
MRVKYAQLLFVLPFPFPRVDTSFQIDEKTRLFSGTILDQLEDPESKFWPEAIGSMSWDSMCDTQYIFSTWAPAVSEATLEVQNDEDEALKNNLKFLFRLVRLVDFFAPSIDDAIAVSGTATLSGNDVSKISIKSIDRLVQYVPSLYYSEFWDEIHDWLDTNVHKMEKIEDLKKIFLQFQNIFIKNSSNRQILEGFRSFDEAMRATQMEFKIPNLVRAIESIICCWKKESFADKTLSLVGHPDSSMPFEIAQNTRELLLDLYELRNDCSHGIPFAYSLEKKIKQRPDDRLIAKYEFLAEWAARKVLNKAFFDDKLLAHTHDRDDLQEAWNKNIFLEKNEGLSKT